MGAFAFIRLDSNIPWNEVETMIYKVITWILTDINKVVEKDDIVEHKAHTTIDYVYENKKDKRFIELFSDYNFEGFGPINAPAIQRYFRHVIEEQFDPDKDRNTTAISMLNSLVLFERHFSDFIKMQAGYGDLNKLNNFYNCAEELFQKILYQNIDNVIFTEKAQTIVDVLSFNYSLDERFEYYLSKKFDPRAGLSINSWSNIHGIACWNDMDAKKELFENGDITRQKDSVKLPPPIFGIDNHEILTEDDSIHYDLRSIFTKSFRLIDNHVNEIRAKEFQEKIDIISFYGHALSSADYSYFESIFDKYDVFHSSVKLEFYYWCGYTIKENLTKEEKEIKSKIQERLCAKKVVELLTSYGSTLSNEHGENIVNKLILERRLVLKPTFILKSASH